MAVLTRPMALAAKRARLLTAGLPPHKAAQALQDAGWKYLGKGSYKICLAKDGLVVKIAKTRRSGGTYHKHSSYDVSADDPHPMKELRYYVDFYKSLPAPLKVNMARPLWSRGDLLCTVQVPGDICPPYTTHPNGCGLDEVLESIKKATGKWIPDVGRGHNHGHDEKGRPVIYDCFIGNHV